MQHRIEKVQKKLMAELLQGSKKTTHSNSPTDGSLKEPLKWYSILSLGNEEYTTTERSTMTEFLRQ